MKRLLFIVVVLFGAVSLAAAGRPVNETRAVEADGTVEISNLAGSVIVRGWDRNQLEVTGTLADEVERLDIETRGRRTTIEVVLPERVREVDGSDLVIRLPGGSRVEVGGVSADISVEAVSGPLELETVSGDIHIADRPSAIEAATVSGRVEVADAPARTEIGSVSGDIVIASASGTLEAENVSGDIDVGGAGLTGAELASVSGSIHLTTDLVGHGDFELESVSGDITLVVPGGAAGRFELSTFSGRLESDLGPAPTRSALGTPGQEVSFATGSGGPSVTVSSFSGRVKVVAR